MKNKNLLKGYIFTIISAVLFGCMGLMANRIKADGVNSVSMVLFRNLLSIPMLGVMALIQEKHLKVPLKALPSITAVALTGCCLTPLLLYASYGLMGSSGQATVLHFVYPAVAAIGAFLLFKQKINAAGIIGIIVCSAGICMFYDPGAGFNITGGIVAIASGFTYAAYIILLSVFKYKQISGFLLSFYISITSSIVLLIVCLASNQLTAPNTFGGWFTCVLLAFTVNVGAVVMFQKGAFYIGAQRASILSTMEPITSVILGALFLHEVIGWRVAIGVVLVLSASVIIAVGDMLKAKKLKQMEEDAE